VSEVDAGPILDGFLSTAPSRLNEAIPECGQRDSLGNRMATSPFFGTGGSPSCWTNSTVLDELDDVDSGGQFDQPLLDLHQ
jgi:hypothetical protein